MNDANDQLGEHVKRAVEAEARELSLAPHIRRSVIAAAKQQQPVSGCEWLFSRKLVFAGIAVVVVALVVAFQVARHEEVADLPRPDSQIEHPRTYSQICAEVRGGPGDRYWKKSYMELRMRNGEQGHLKIEVQWPKQKSILFTNTTEGEQDEDDEHCDRGGNSSPCEPT